MLNKTFFSFLALKKPLIKYSLGFGYTTDLYNYFPINVFCIVWWSWWVGANTLYLLLEWHQHRNLLCENTPEHIKYTGKQVNTNYLNIKKIPSVISLNWTLNKLELTTLDRYNKTCLYWSLCELYKCSETCLYWTTALNTTLDRHTLKPL